MTVPVDTELIDAVQTIAVTDIFVTDFAKIERASAGNTRLYFSAEQDGQATIVAQFVVPDECVVKIRQKMVEVLGPPLGTSLITDRKYAGTGG